MATEHEERIRFRLEWIAELEAKIDAMHEGWTPMTADGARICAAVLFPDWSPELDARRTILELKSQGHSNREVAQATGWNLREVQRFLEKLRGTFRI